MPNYVNIIPPVLDNNKIERFWSFMDKSEGHGPDRDCWIWLRAKVRGGYGSFWTSKDRSVTAHRLALYLHTGNWPTQHVLHKCDNPPCCNPDHLWEGNNDDNIADKVAKARTLKGDDHCMRKRPELVPRGERSGRTHLKNEDVLEIRRLNAEKCSHKIIAERFQISRPTVSHICRGYSWRHI